MSCLYKLAEVSEETNLTVRCKVQNHQNENSTTREIQVAIDPCIAPLEGDFRIRNERYCTNKEMSIRGNFVLETGGKLIAENQNFVFGNNVTLQNNSYFEANNSQNSIVFNGDVLINGTVIWNNVHVIFNATYNGSLALLVDELGNLTILNRTNITNGDDPNSKYGFKVGSTTYPDMYRFSMSDSYMSDAGWSGSFISVERRPYLFSNNTFERVEGFRLEGVNNSFINGMNVYDSQAGLRLFNSHNNFVNNSVFSINNNISSAILINLSNNNTLNEVATIYGNNGIEVENSSFTSINSSFFYLATSKGAYFSYSNHTSLNNITALYNDFGIYFALSYNTSLQNSEIHNNAWGVYIIFSDMTLLSNTIFYDNTVRGIYITTSNNNFLSSVQAYNNTAAGISILTSDNSSLTNISAYNNSQYGLSFSSSNNISVSSGNISNNVQYGIYSTDSNLTINSNIVCFNGLLDFNSSNWHSSTGDENTCDNPDSWNDNGTTGCTYACTLVNNTPPAIIILAPSSPVVFNESNAFNFTANITDNDGLSTANLEFEGTNYTPTYGIISGAILEQAHTITRGGQMIH